MMGRGPSLYFLTVAFQGVCVRHNDDCNAVSVPRNEDDTKINRVCTKVAPTQTTLPLTRCLEGLQQDRQSAQGECSEG